VRMVSRSKSVKIMVLNIQLSAISLKTPHLAFDHPLSSAEGQGKDALAED
jgi:hypothetical protein